MKKIAILGSTGSIGKSCISLLQNELKDKFELEFLSFHSNSELAFNQAIILNVKTVIATSREGYAGFKALNHEGKIKLLYGDEELQSACKNKDIEVILIAIVGVCGLEFTLASIINSKRVLAIANKESIVCGFHLIKEKLLNSQTQILPVDSEHNSLYRLLKGTLIEEVSSAFITASGGPFYGKKFYDLKEVEIRDVISHPTWNMGAKISVDSASMANKGLELIEAYNLFDFKKGKIEAFVSRGSLLHAGVNFKDGSSHWFLSKPEMKTHISNAILDGKVCKMEGNQIGIEDLKTLQFDEIKKDEFPIFFIAKEVAESKNILGAISFNILNEIAVSLFLQNKIKYTKILDIIENNLFFNPSNLQFKSVNEIKEYCTELTIKVV